MATITLIVDLQVDYFKHERLKQRRPTLVARTNQLVGAARSVGSSIVWVKTEYSPDLHDASLEVRKGQIHITIAGSPGASLLPELNVRHSDAIVLKKRYSAFFGTDLDSILERSSCSQLIVAGINTHACIRATVVDAYQRDIDVLLARDCIDSYDEEHDRVTWRYMNGKLGRGLTNQELIEILRRPRI
jgi:nicotinamidase-related amidase